MQPQSDLTQQNNKSALGYMLLKVLLYSTFPLAFAIGNATHAPFLFSALLTISAATSGVIFLTWYHKGKRKQSTTKTLKTISSKLYTFDFLMVVVAHSDYVFFAMALSFINVAIATIFLSIYPFFMVFLTARLFKKNGRYRKVTPDKWVLFVLAFIGMGFVVASQSENFTSIFGDLLNQNAAIGITLVLLAAIASALSPPYSLNLGATCHKESGYEAHGELFFSMAFYVISLAFGAVLFIVLGLLSNESLSDINIWPAIVFGFIGQGVGSIAFRAANIKTNNLSLNALTYATPVVSLAWLGIASLIDVPHFDWLIIGATAIIIANLLVNFKNNIRPTHKVLIIALWLFATLTYLIQP